MIEVKNYIPVNGAGLIAITCSAPMIDNKNTNLNIEQKKLDELLKKKQFLKAMLDRVQERTFSFSDAQKINMPYTVRILESI